MDAENEFKIPSVMIQAEVAVSIYQHTLDEKRKLVIKWGFEMQKKSIFIKDVELGVLSK